MKDKITRRNMDIFLKKHATSEKVVDIGSGGSSYHRFFPNRITVDIDPNRKPDIIGDAHDLPFKDEEVDIILSTDVLEHLKDPKKAVSEMKRVLKKGGKIIFITRFLFPIHDSPNDYWRFSKYGLLELFDGFEILEIEPETTNFSTLAVLLQRIGYQTEFFFNKPIKFFIFLLAYLLQHCNWIIKREYGNIARGKQESGILASGYYMIIRKPY